MFVFVFVFFNSCWINLDYEWNSLLKKIVFIFFKTYKNKFDFSIVKNHFFLSSQYRSRFLPSKTNFSTYYKIDLVFWQIIFFFINQNKFEFFLNIRRDFIHKKICVIWFFFIHMFNISFITCIKKYIGHKSLEGQTSIFPFSNLASGFGFLVK